MSYSLEPKDLPPYAHELLIDTVGLSGYPFWIVEKAGLGYDVSLSVGRPSQPFHLLTYVQPLREHFLHFLVNACFKVLRVFELDPAERFLPVPNAGRRLPQDEEAEFRRRNPGLSPEVAYDMSVFMYGRLSEQVTSVSLDIRIERDIAKTLPDHAGPQRAELSQQIANMEPLFDSRVAALMPPRVYAATCAVNLAMVEQAAEIAGFEIGPVFRGSPHRPLAEQLLGAVRGVGPQGHAGDRLLADRWAKMLGVRDWYRWKPFL